MPQCPTARWCHDTTEYAPSAVRSLPVSEGSCASASPRTLRSPPTSCSVLVPPSRTSQSSRCPPDPYRCPVAGQPPVPSMTCSLARSCAPATVLSLSDVAFDEMGLALSYGVMMGGGAPPAPLAAVQPAKVLLCLFVKPLTRGVPSMCLLFLSSSSFFCCCCCPRTIAHQPSECARGFVVRRRRARKKKNSNRSSSRRRTKSGRWGTPRCSDPLPPPFLFSCLFFYLPSSPPFPISRALSHAACLLSFTPPWPRTG